MQYTNSPVFPILLQHKEISCFDSLPRAFLQITVVEARKIFKPSIILSLNATGYLHARECYSNYMSYPQLPKKIVKKFLSIDL